MLLEAGASPRETCEAGATALHAAARRGPLELVELLIRHGALGWQADRRGKTRAGLCAQGLGSPTASAIVELLDRPVIRDERFRDAVKAIHAGNVGGPWPAAGSPSRAVARARDRARLLSARAIFAIPSCSGSSPATPTLVRKMPANIADIAQVMIARGVEQADLDYTLELVMSSGGLRQPGLQVALVGILDGRGRRRHAAGDPGCPRALRSRAGLGVARSRHADDGADRRSARPRRRAALASASMRRPMTGRRRWAWRSSTASSMPPACASMPAPIPINSCRCTATPCRCITAALNDDVEMLKLLVARGARLDTRDTLWNGTPLGWAVHNKKAEAEAYLRSLQQ